MTNAHLITNYWKRMLREMQEPLIPFVQYEEFAKLVNVEDDQKLDFIKKQID